jgi:hypothetical protein
MLRWKNADHFVTARIFEDSTIVDAHSTFASRCGHAVK